MAPVFPIREASEVKAWPHTTLRLRRQLPRTRQPADAPPRVGVGETVRYAGKHGTPRAVETHGFLPQRTAMPRVQPTGKGENHERSPECRASVPSATPFPIAVRPLQHSFQKRTDEKHRPTPSVPQTRGHSGCRKATARHAGNPRHPDHPRRHTRRRRPHHPRHRRRVAHAAADRAGRGDRQPLGRQHGKPGLNFPPRLPRSFLQVSGGAFRTGTGSKHLSPRPKNLRKRA